MAASDRVDGLRDAELTDEPAPRKVRAAPALSLPCPPDPPRPYKDNGEPARDGRAPPRQCLRAPTAAAAQVLVRYPGKPAF